MGDVLGAAVTGAAVVGSGCFLKQSGGFSFAVLLFGFALRHESSVGMRRLMDAVDSDARAESIMTSGGYSIDAFCTESEEVVKVFVQLHLVADRGRS
jgi:hypothetical protein